jgi:hypothetical protein
MNIVELKMRFGAPLTGLNFPKGVYAADRSKVVPL